MTSFWKNLPQPYFILAPMEAVTDVVFRHVIAEAGKPDVFFTEFTNTNSWCSPRGKHSTRGRLTFTPDEQPIVAHIWGNVPEYYAEMSRGMAELGFSGIDINMGCPAPNVAPKGSGSGLINTPENAAAIIAAAKVGGLPVSVKTRLGYTRVDEWEGWLTHLLQQDIANLTIHLRTRKEMSKVPAHYELIDDIVALRDRIAPETLLTINGDIRDREHGLELIAEHPGVNGVMIGRGVFHNPFAFALETRPHTREELVALLERQLDLFDQYEADMRKPFETLKRFFKIYIRDFDGASELRDALMHTKNTTEVRELLNR
jgi:tRNA-dihydrouridine synthase